MSNKEIIRFDLRRMNAEDIPSGMRLKALAGWNQLEADWRLFLEACREGCLVAEYKGRVIGTVTTISYEEKFSWIGMLLVDPDYRRMGVGTTLLEKAIVAAREKGTVRLDATPEGKMLYDTIGFKDEYRLSRFQHRLILKKNLPQPQLECRVPGQEDLRKIFTWDEIVFGARRKIILKALQRMGASYSWVIEERGQLRGYVLGRPGSNFEQIGPVIATDEQAAESLLLHALQHCEGKAVVVDVPDEQEAFCKMLRSLGFTVQRPFIRMYQGKLTSPGQPHLQYAIAGPEIG